MDDLDPVALDQASQLDARLPRPHGARTELKSSPQIFSRRRPHPNVMAGLAEQARLVLDDTVLPGDRAGEIPRVKNRNAHSIARPRSDLVSVLRVPRRRRRSARRGLWGGPRFE